MIEELANIDLERNFLSSAIKTNKFIEVAELIRDEHFTVAGHREILKAIKNLMIVLGSCLLLLLVKSSEKVVQIA